MLQVARLAPQQLGESSSLVASFLAGRLNPDGGFQNRAGESDLYYTVFGIEGLVALQAEVPAVGVAAYLRRFGDGDGLDFVHLACLARAWAGLAADPAGLPARAILARLEAFRSRDGGYAQTPGAAVGSVYAAFLASGAYQDLGGVVPDEPKLAAAVRSLRADDGGFANRPGDRHGVTTVTAAAVLLLRHADTPVCSTAAIPLAASWQRPPRRSPTCSRRQPRSMRSRPSRCPSPAWPSRASISSIRCGPTVAASSATGPTTWRTASTRTMRCWRSGI
jgi:hypothetical protein